MANIGYTGIAFPFRISAQGGLLMSTTSMDNPAHIMECVRQLLRTSKGERVMQPEVYSDLDTYLFEPNDVTLQEVIKSRILSVLRKYEPRVECTPSDIVFSMENTDEGEFLYAEVTLRIKKYETTYTEKFNLGEVA